MSFLTLKQNAYVDKTKPLVFGLYLSESCDCKMKKALLAEAAFICNVNTTKEVFTDIFLFHLNETYKKHFSSSKTKFVFLK